MNLFITAIFFLWFAGTLKSILFWLYLWQLKDYHIARFLDHFRTAKGKRVFRLYLTQFLFWRLKKPVFTGKMILLTGIALLATTAYALVFPNVVALVAYNAFVPLIVSAIVLLVQPLFVLMRMRILNNAKVKVSQHKNLKVIGITGSYGKTAAKEFLATILSARYRVLATPEHKNSEMGIADTVLSDLRPEHEIFIVEMGAYSKGGIKLLCDMVKPQVGVVTGVNGQHLATFGSLENLLSAEGGQELLASLPSSGLLVVNGDNQHCLDLYKRAQIHKKVYTLEKSAIAADMWAEEITVKSSSVDFMAINHRGEAGHIFANVLGRQQVQNLLGAILVAQQLGMTMSEIMEACKRIRAQQAGMTLKQGVHGISVVDSSYSANPDGVYADLDYLKVFSGKKIIVMPCLIELGGKSVQIHKKIGEKVAEVCDMAIITTRDRFEEIRSAAAENRMPADKIMFLENPQEIFHEITTFCSNGDVVLLEGGRPKELINLLHGK